jgi:hypothetical protein
MTVGPPLRGHAPRCGPHNDLHDDPCGRGVDASAKQKTGTLISEIVRYGVYPAQHVDDLGVIEGAPAARRCYVGSQCTVPE